MPKKLYRPDKTHVWYNPACDLMVLGSWKKKRKYLFKTIDTYQIELEDGKFFEFEHFEANFFENNAFDFIGLLDE